MKYILLVVVGLLIGVFIGFNLHSKVPEAPAVTVTPPQPRHDTIPGAAVLVYRTARDTIHDTLRRVDTAKVEAVRDSATCWAWGKQYPDGAVIGATLCSDSLPAHKPLDLLCMIDYTPKPDSIRTIVKSVGYKPPMWETVRDYSVFGLGCFAGGAIVGMIIKNNIK